MTLELARVRLRGIYAIVAGALLVIGIPVFEGLFLAPLGYLEAVQQSGGTRGFAPLVGWIAQDTGPDVAFHIIELITFLLVVPLPGSLRRALVAPDSKRGRIAVWLGQAGFCFYVLAVALGVVTTIQLHGIKDVTGAAPSFAGAYAIQSLLSHVVGGLLVAASLVLTSITIANTRVFPDWLGFCGLIPAALLTVTAVQFAASPEQVETGASPFNFLALGLWLIVVGVMLARLRSLPQPAATPAQAAGSMAAGEAEQTEDGAETAR